MCATFCRCKICESPVPNMHRNNPNITYLLTYLYRVMISSRAHTQYIYIYIYIYIYRGRQKCQLAALQRIFCCSAALLAKVYTTHILLQQCYYQCQTTGYLYYQIAAAQWRMVHFGTPRVGPIHTPNIGPIDEGLISIPAMESHPYSPVKRIKAPDISYDGTTTK